MLRFYLSYDTKNIFKSDFCQENFQDFAINVKHCNGHHIIHYKNINLLRLLVLIYLNAKVSQPFNICVFFSMVHVRIFI